jgi:hypothetical protein
MTIRNPYIYNKKIRAMIIQRSKAKSKRIATERAEALKPLREFVADAIEQHQKQAGND